MSQHYSAFQYDAAYKPTALRNWEIPKYFCHRPRPRTGSTQIIANAMGNLLPGVHRSEDSPWGNFIGTWSMPRKIDRKIAATLNGSADFKIKAHKCYLHYTAKPVQRQENEDEPNDKLQAEIKRESKAEEVTSAKIEEKDSKMEEVDIVETQEESQIDPGRGVAEQEVVTKRLCPIHDVVND